MAGRKPLEGGVVASGGDGDGGGAPSAEGDAEKVATDQGGEEEAGVKPVSSSSHKDVVQEKDVAERGGADVKVAPPEKVAADQGGEEEAGVKPASSSSHKDEDQEKAVAEGANAGVKVALQEPRQKPKKKTKWRTTSRGSYVYEPQILLVATNQPITLSTCLAGTVVGQHGKQLPTADIPVSNYHTGAVFKRSHDGPAPPMVTIVAAGAWRGRAQKQGPQP